MKTDEIYSRVDRENYWKTSITLENLCIPNQSGVSEPARSKTCIQELQKKMQDRFPTYTC